MGFVRFLALAVVGFGLGAGIAFFQNMRYDAPPLPPFPQEEVVAETSVAAEKTSAPVAQAEKANPLDAAVATSVDMADIPDMPVASDVSASRMPVPKTAAAKPEKVATSSDVGDANFTLSDQDGTPRTGAEWPDQYMLVFFGFTHCPEICPTAMDKITTVMESLGPKAAQVKPLFFTIDPSRDTPARLKEFLSDYHDSITGLTGTEKQMKRIQDAFKVYAAKSKDTEGDTENYLMDHSAYIFLMSKGQNSDMLEIFGQDKPVAEIIAKIKPHLD